MPEADGCNGDGFQSPAAKRGGGALHCFGTGRNAGAGHNVWDGRRASGSRRRYWPRCGSEFAGSASSPIYDGFAGSVSASVCGGLAEEYRLQLSSGFAAGGTKVSFGMVFSWLLSEAAAFPQVNFHVLQYRPCQNSLLCQAIFPIAPRSVCSWLTAWALWRLELRGCTGASQGHADSDAMARSCGSGFSFFRGCTLFPDVLRLASRPTD